MDVVRSRGFRQAPRSLRHALVKIAAKYKAVGWRCLECATKVNNEWAAENREHAAKKALEWRNNNLVRAREREAAWYRENPEVNIRKAHVRRARIKQVGGKLSKGITKALFAKQKGKCASCNEKLSLEKGLDKAHLDHILPLALGGPNTDENVQLLCRLCNQRKGAKHPTDWIVKTLSTPTDDCPAE
jgi:5-methylcytosine-specific restriction endonuclease McrA